MTTFLTDTEPENSTASFYDKLIKLLGTNSLDAHHKPNDQEINDLLRMTFPDIIQPPSVNATCKDEVPSKSIEETPSADTPPIPKLWLNTKQNREYPPGTDYVARSLDRGHVEYSIIHNEKVEKEIVDLQSDKDLRKVSLQSNGTINFITNKEMSELSENLLVFPIPEHNETIPADTQLDAEALFPIVSKSLQIFPVYQKALRYLEVISYQAIDHVTPTKFFDGTDAADSTSPPVKRRKIKILEHNLSHLLATIRTIPTDVREFFENYLKALQFADSKQEHVDRRADYLHVGASLANEVSTQRKVKIINLTDYLLSTLNANVIPRQLSGYLDNLYDYLLVELNNDDLRDFFPKTTSKSGFILELFDFLQKSKTVDGRVKNLIDMFRPFVSK